ncbi:MAG: right-handed parallel beta-helix repeat-containing protein [Nitrospira sp.]|nr:right-handed parallel beta-helix repeat-containing protein [Nitrospira sp.]
MTLIAANPMNLQQCADAANPGDSIELGSGIYENNWRGSSVLKIRRSGSPGLPITFLPALNAMPIIAAAENWAGILVEAANYIRIERLPVTGIARLLTYEGALAASTLPSTARYSANGISIYNSRNVVVRNCTITDMPGGGIYAVGCDYLTIDRNIVTGCCMWSRYGQSGISVHKSAAVNASTATKIKVRYNSCHGNENRIPWEMTGKIQDGHGIIFDECQDYPAPMLAYRNLCVGNGGLAIQALTAPTAVLVENIGQWNDRSNVTV